VAPPHLPRPLLVVALVPLGDTGIVLLSAALLFAV